MDSMDRYRAAVTSVFAVLGLFSLFQQQQQPRQQQNVTDAEAERIYTTRCASCHDNAVPRAPNRQALKRIAAENISRTLTDGTMRAQAAGLNVTEIAALARLLGTTGTAPASGPGSGSGSGANACTARDPFVVPENGAQWNGWGGTPAQQRFQPAASAQLTADHVARLKVKWAFAFPNVAKAWAQPTVVGGRVFVGSAGRTIYSLDAKSGCQYWAFTADAGVRTAISISRGDTPLAFFGDQRANAYALDAATGALVWKTHVEDHEAAVITGAPTLAGGTLYVPVSSGEEAIGTNPKYQCCTFRGSVVALEATSGKVVWKTYTITDTPKPVRTNKKGTQLFGPSGAAVWTSPTVDIERQIVYVTTGDGYSDPVASTTDSFLAFDARTGKLLWSRQMTANDAFTIDCDFPEAMRTNCPAANGPDHDFGSSPMLVTIAPGHRALIAGQKSGMVHAVDPDNEGKVLWSTRVGKGGRLGGVQWGPAADADHVYVAVSDVLLKFVEKGTPGAQQSFLGAMLLDPQSGGGLTALKLATGERVWQTPHPGCGSTPGCSPAQSAAVTATPDLVFSGGLDGHVRAYAARDGKILWDDDTKRDYTAVNGVQARGGSLDGPGPVVVGGMVFVSSGYAYLATVPGNVLLAYTVDGK
jgi:polyvinyl alcohol dehydrogenase (cytochrome)